MTIDLQIIGRASPNPLFFPVKIQLQQKVLGKQRGVWSKMCVRPLLSKSLAIQNAPVLGLTVLKMAFTISN